MAKLKDTFLIKEGMPGTKKIISPWQSEEPDDGTMDTFKENFFQQMKLLPGLEIVHFGDNKDGTPMFYVTFNKKPAFWIKTDRAGKVAEVLQISKSW